MKKLQTELKGQLYLSGGAMETVMKQAETIHRYEAERERLKRTCKSYGEYEEEVNQLRRRLRI